MKIEILPSLWISTYGYSENAEFLKDKNIGLDRKVLADMAVNDPEGFSELVKSIN